MVDIVPFLIKTKSDLIVIDPGLGLESVNGEFQIHEHIKALGYSYEEVSMVLLSHLHKDHAGGICYGAGTAFNLMFPKANIFCQQKEMEYAFSKKDSPSYVHEKLTYLSHSPNLQFLNGDGNITPEIRYQVSGWHTPYHQVFYISEQGETFFYGGDVAPQSSQMIRRFIAKYDFDGRKSSELRQAYLKQGTQEHWHFLFFHDAKKPVAQFEQVNDRYRIIIEN